uniref:Uncharacterized protein n=1 Tax=viral metagenome TaxID=1070528 RepID=A0A6C0E4P5_9ZZZZ
MKEEYEELDIDISHLGTREKKYEFIQFCINLVVSENHLKNISDLNRVYKLYSDGSVTEDDILILDVVIRPDTFFTFPLKCEKYDNTYAILPYDVCKNIRVLINHFLLQT